MTTLETVKLLLGITDTESDKLLEQLLASAAYRIIDYCNIDEVPDELADVQTHRISEITQHDEFIKIICGVTADGRR